MELIPIYQLQAANQGAAIGVIHQPSSVSSEDFGVLYGSQGYERDGMFYERNTGHFIQEPVPIWADIRATDVTLTTPPGAPADPAPILREVFNRATNSWMVAQGSGKAGVEWALTTNTVWVENRASFSILLQLHPCPKDAPHGRDDCYRSVIWPADAAPGDTTYRAIFRYGEKARLESTTDGAAAIAAWGATWSICGEIDAFVDMGKLRTFDNLSLLVTVLPLDGQVVVWAGSDLGRDTLAYRGPFTNPGTLRFEGKNGLFEAAYADLRHKARAEYVSYPKLGPRNMAAYAPAGGNVSNAVQVYLQPGSADYPAGCTATGIIDSIDARSALYRYRLTLTGPPLPAPNDAYSADTAMVRFATVYWPPQFQPPPASADWQDVTGIRRIEEDFTFDLETGLTDLSIPVLLDNAEGQRIGEGGLTAVRLAFGYQHTGLTRRGIVLGRTRNVWSADGGDSTYQFQSSSLLYVVAKQPIKDDIYPRKWCVYALARFLLEHGSIVPPLQARIFPGCQFGPDPPCVHNGLHPQMPPHPGWKLGTRVLSCLSELRDILGAWMGQDADGFFRFEPFEWGNVPPAKKWFAEGPTTGLFANILYAGSEANEALKGLRRARSLDNVRNEIILAGWNQANGQIMTGRYENKLSRRSIEDSSYPGYLGFAAPLVHAWSGYSDPDFMDFCGERFLERLPIPEETIEPLPCHGQPTIFPMDVVGVSERRTVGAGSTYWVTRIRSALDFGAPIPYLSWIWGMYTNTGRPPGV